MYLSLRPDDCHLLPIPYPWSRLQFEIRDLPSCSIRLHQMAKMSSMSFRRKPPHLLLTVHSSIVFVHGLNGHPKNTWSHGNGFFWPWELRNVLNKARVMTFGYNAGMGSDLTENFIRIKGIASSLNGALANRRLTAEVCLQRL